MTTIYVLVNPHKFAEEEQELHFQIQPYPISFSSVLRSILRQLHLMSPCATHEVNFSLWPGTAYRSDQETFKTGIFGPALPQKAPMRIWQLDREHGLLVRGAPKIWCQTCLCAPLSLCPEGSGDMHYTGCVNACTITCVKHEPYGQPGLPPSPSFSFPHVLKHLDSSICWWNPCQREHHPAQNPHSYTDETEYSKEGQD